MSDRIKRCCDLCNDKENKVAWPVKTINEDDLYFCVRCGFVDEEDTVMVIYEVPDETD